MKPLEVFALDETFQRKTGSIPYKSLQWNRKYNEPGDFAMEIPKSLYDPAWEYIYADDRPETGIIQKVEAVDSARDSVMSQGEDTVILSGFFLETWLNNFIFLEETVEEETYLVYVSKPARPSVKPPKIYEGPGGYYMSRETRYGPQYYDMNGNAINANTAEGDTVIRLLQEVPAIPSNGIRENPDHTTVANYGYVAQHDSTVDVYYAGTAVCNSYEIEHSFDGTGVLLYKDNNDNLRWTTGAVYQEAVNDYRREAANWERESKSIVTWTGYSSGYVERTRKVMSPFSLRVTDVNEALADADNVRYVINWAQRLFGATMLYDVPDFSGVVKHVDPSMQRFGDLAYSELATIGASCRVLYDFKSDSMVFQTWRGLDRTQSQTQNPFAVFSDTWGTLYDFKVSTDKSNYRNTCYVMYEYEVPTKWTADGKPDYEPISEFNRDTGTWSYTGWQIPFEKRRGYVKARLDDGLDDCETYLDMRGDKPADDDKWPRDRQNFTSLAAKPVCDGACRGARERYAQYAQGLEEAGKRHLRDKYSVITNLDTGTIVTDAYMTDWDLGDKVDLRVNTLGLVEEKRIIACSEVHESGSSTVTIEIGEPLLTDTDKAVRL